MNETDLPSVVQVATLLRVSEFEVFRLAYQQWFGHPPRELALKAPFQHYLQSAMVPAWVRSFVRQVLALQQRGQLDPTTFGITPVPPASRTSVMVGITVFAGLGLVLVMLLWLILQTQNANPNACLFPPCY